MCNLVDPNKLIAELRAIEINWEGNPIIDEYIYEHMNKVEDCIDKASKEWSSTERLLFAGDHSYFSLCEGRWYLSLNDTWYYATADGELIDESQYEEVAEWFRKYGRAGLLYWAYLKRKTYPQIPRNKAKVVAIENLEKELLDLDRKQAEFQKEFFKKS